jgi:hypothetical protein
MGYKSDGLKNGRLITGLKLIRKKLKIGISGKYS